MPNTNAFTKPRPGDIEILSLVLSNFDGSESWDIRNLTLEFNLYESLDQDHLRLDLVMNDALSLIGRMPILGEEKLFVSFRTPSIAPDTFEYRTIQLQMVVVNCQKLQYTRTRTEMFKLEFVDAARIANQKAIVQDLLQGPISAMVTQVGSTYLGLNQTGAGAGQATISAGATAGIHSFVIPSLSPFETIHFLAGEAQSAQYLSSNFLFFQGSDGYRFYTSEQLMSEPVGLRGFHGEEGGTYYITEHSLFNSPIAKDIQIPDIPVPEGYKLAGFINGAEWRHIFHFTVEQLFDLESNLNQGTYDNQVTTIDPILQQYENVKTLTGQDYFDYLSHFPSFRKTDEPERPGNELITPYSLVAGGSGQSSKRYLITNRNQGLDINFAVLPRLRQDFLPYLSSMLGQMNTVVAHISVPGDSNRTVGDVIKFDLHEIGSTDDVLGELHEYLAGKWLITALRHKYTHDSGYWTVMKCIKNCFDTSIHNSKPERTSPTIPFPFGPNLPLVD